MENNNNFIIKNVISVFTEFYTLVVLTIKET